MRGLNSNSISAYNMARLFAGFILIAMGILFAVYAKLGLRPWSIFHMGISIQTRVSYLLNEFHVNACWRKMRFKIRRNVEWFV